MEENKKENKGLIVLVILLILCVISLAGYIVYDKVLSNNKQSNNQTDETTTIQVSVDRKVGDCYEVNGNKRCVSFKEKNIEIELENESGNLFINDNKLISDRSVISNSTCDIHNPTIIDGDYIILTCGGAEEYYYFFNSKGEMAPLNFEKINDIGLVGIAEFKDNNITIISLGYIGDYEAALCRDNKDDDIVYIEQQIKYEGNGVFSEPKTIKTKTTQEVIKERYDMSCDELKNTDNPYLEYAKSLATGE